MARSGYVDAVWVGAFVGELPDKSILIPGESVVEVGKDEAEQSENWKPVSRSEVKKLEEKVGGDS